METVSIIRIVCRDKLHGIRTHEFFNESFTSPNFLGEASSLTFVVEVTARDRDLINGVFLPLNSMFERWQTRTLAMGRYDSKNVSKIYTHDICKQQSAYLFIWNRLQARRGSRGHR